MPGDRAFAPRRFDFASQSPEEFEELCFALVRAEFDDVVRLAAPDQGLDCLLFASDGAAARGWQAKRFTGSIAWGQCRDSLARAIEHHDPRRVTFCFARDLTGPQHRLFVKHLVTPHPSLTVDYWAASELAARLNSESGRVVARRFFGDPLGDADRIARAVRAGGDLKGAADVLDRQSAIGEFQAGTDPFFFYQSGVREVEAPETPAAPGTAVRLERVKDGIASRIDVQPRTADALARHGPAGRLVFSDDDAGRRALQEFAQLREQGGRLELDEGVAFTMDRVPPGLTDLVEDLGSPRPGKVIVEHSGPGIWPVTLRARNDDGETAELPLALRPAPGPRADGHAILTDCFGGLKVTLDLVPGQSPPGNLNWSYSNDQSPAAQQLTALRFLQTIHRRATIEVLANEQPAPLAHMRTDLGELDSWLGQMLEVFEALVRIEQINDLVFDIPGEFDERQGRVILELGRMLRDGGAEVTWTDFRLVIRPEGLSQLLAGGPLRVTEEVYANLLGHEVHIGKREVQFEHYKVASTEAVSPSPDADLQVTFVPAQTPAVLWVTLVPAEAE
jgi:hypothetical protein